MGVCTSKHSNIVHATITVQPYRNKKVSFSESTPDVKSEPSTIHHMQTQRSTNYFQLRKAMIDPRKQKFRRALTVGRFDNESIQYDRQISDDIVAARRPLKEERPTVNHAKNLSEISQETCITLLSNKEESSLFEDNLQTGSLDDDSNDVEASCHEVISKLVSNDKEIRDKVHALLSVWEESEQMAAIRNHARSASSEVASDLLLLSDYLTKSNAKYLQHLEESTLYHSILAKIFAIYYWICTNVTYNSELWQKYLSNEWSDCDSLLELEAEEVLNSRSSICVGYANLFAEMTEAVGIEVKVIKGETTYVPVPALAGHEARTSSAVPHTWNVVKVEDTWFPVDCTFGANYRDKSMEFKSHYTRHFFATTPSTFILTHWPNEKQWQLLKTPISRDIIDPLVVFPSCACGRGVLPLTWRRSIKVSEKQQSAVIELRANPSLKIGAKLVFMDDDIGKCHEIQASNNLIYMQRDGDLVCIRAALPFKGAYSLLVSINQEKKRASQLPQVFLSYHVTCMRDSYQEIGYPKVYEMAAAAFEFRLLYWTQSLYDCICESETEELSLAFKAKRGMTCSHFLIPGKTRNTTATDHTMVYNYNTMIVADGNSTKGQDDNDQCLHMLKVVFPEEGWWTICLNGTKSNPNSQTQGGYVTLMSYHVYAQKGDSNSSFPYILSPKVSFCHFDPIPSISESIEVPFTTTKPMSFQAYIVQKKPNAHELDPYAQVEKAKLVCPSPNQYQLKVIFPKPGKWYVRVFGQEEKEDNLSSRNDTLVGLFSLLVDVEKPMKDALLVTLNSKFAEKIQLKLQDNGYISFTDNGQPLTIDFESEKTSKIFRHHIRPESPDDHPLLEEHKDLNLLQHCTYLSSNSPSKMSLSLTTMKVRPKLNKLRSQTQPVLPTHLFDFSNVFRLYAAFPWAGRWVVELFALSPDSSEHTLAFHITIEVTKPSRGICYPILHSGFHQFGISIPNQFVGYNPISNSTEFDFPFNAPQDLKFAWNIQVAESTSSFIHQGFVHQFGNRNPSHHFQLSFSTPGVWKAQLFGAKEGKDDEEEVKYLPIFEISLQVNAIDRDVAFPEIFPAFKKYGLSIAKTHLPFISRVHKAHTHVVIPLYSPGNVKFWHRVECPNTDLVEYQPLTQMLSYENSGLHEIAFEISEPGTFKILLWAQWMEDQGKEWDPVLRHIIECTA